MARDEKEQKVLVMLQDKSILTDDIIRYVKGECRDIAFTPQTLGMLFERIAGVEYNEDDPMSCFSADISIDILANIHPSFRSTNGCQWACGKDCYKNSDLYNNQYNLLYKSFYLHLQANQ